MDVKSDLTSEYISRLELYEQAYYKALQSKVIETNLKPVPLLNLNSYNRDLICFLAREIKPYVSTKIIFDYATCLDSVKDKGFAFF
jgi:hypothetical protein